MSEDAVPAPLVPSTPAVRPRWSLLLAVGLVGAVVGAGAVGAAWGLSRTDPAPTVAAVSPAPSPSGDSFTLMGSMTLLGATHSIGATDCVGNSGYEDIAEGAPVTVYDAGSQIVAKGALLAGRRMDGQCVFSVRVDGVPSGPAFYQVEIARRGKLTLSAADARASKLAATLG